MGGFKRRPLGQFFDDVDLGHIACLVFRKPPLLVGVQGDSTGNTEIHFEGSPSPHGYGSKLTHQETAGFSLLFHLPGFHFGYPPTNTEPDRGFL